MPTEAGLLDEMCDRIAAHARPDLQTGIEGLLLSNVAITPAVPEYSVTHPLLAVMVQGGKQLMLGDKIYKYGGGDCLVITANVPVTGHWIDTDGTGRALGMGLVLRPAAIAELVLQAPSRRWTHGASGAPAIATGAAEPELLDAATRLLRLLDHPADAPVLGPLIEQEILWRVLSGPLGDALRQIGLADSRLSHVSRAIAWIRGNFAEPMRIDDLAQLSGLSTSAFHRHFRAVTALSPLQFQKCIRLQQARLLLVTRPGDIAGVGHLVGYDSPSQFNREYRRMFGAPPGLDAERLRTQMPIAPSL